MAQVSLRTLAIGCGVTAVYVVAARVGFQFAFVAEQITTVWAPSGIAIAALLVWGRALWPAVWLGAFMANAGAAVPWWAAASIASGNTLEAVCAVTVLARLPAFDTGLAKVQDVVAFVLVGAFLSTTIAATTGVVTLSMAGVQPWTRFGELWRDWWLGDALGILVVAPVILTFAQLGREPLPRRRMVEAALLLGATVVTTHLVFGAASGSAVSGHPLEFVIFPLVVTAAMRLQAPVTPLVVLLAAAVTIWHTVRGMGPFGGVEAQQSLIQLQTFMGVLAATGLLLAAATAERRTGDRRRAAAHAVGGVLATARDLTDAAPVILKAIGSNLEWQFGGLWIVDDDGRELRCAATWTDGSRNVRTFNDVSRRMSFARGVGLPGRVWATGQAAWVRDVVRDTNFPRAPFAHAAGLHGAFAFPIHLAGSVVGVVECFNRVVLPPDAGLLATMSTVGHQIGQFIGRRRVDAAKARAERERDEMFEREQRARREAETANRAKDEFLATLSHELRTPLNAIVGWTRMLLDGSLNETDARKALHVIDRNAQLQTQLIADILDVSRIITGGLRLNPGPVNFGQLIGAAVEAIEPAARAKNIRLASCVRLSAQVHEGAPERLQQVVWNLVANAVKFTPSGGSVEVTAVDGDRGGVRIRVEDTGMGIDPSFLPYVFDRFRQADGSISRRHGGLGLGLAIVRHLVELHGGTVRAESRGLGHGATFLVDLPQPDQTLLR